MQRIEKVQPSRTVLFIRFYQLQSYLLGGLLLLLLLLLGLSLIFLCRGCFLYWRGCFFLLLGLSLIFYWRGCFFLLLFFLDGNKETNNILGLDHVIFINLKLSEDIINLSLGHLVSPGHESVGEHLGVNLALVVV